IADGRSRYVRWHLARADARDAGSVPSVVVETVREWTALWDRGVPPLSVASVMSITADEVRVIVVGDHHARSGGAAFGVLVHGVLAQVPFDADRQALEEI